MIIDTSFLIDLLKGKDQKVLKKAEELDRKLIMKGVSSVSVMELWRGALRSLSQDKERAKVDALLRSVIVFSFTEESGKKAAEIETELLKEGKMIDLEDIMIAATALTKNQSVLTKNRKHFERVHELELEAC
ncbi:VapC toxin family PIN domain ribonuclease [Candidatus Woesearchaeota archaeon]|nr:VapC toxin family PIN domain ribonuclease [Candidatus Woesearchaeota archaeon]